MGLFSRKKRREQEPRHSFVGPVHAQEATERSSLASHTATPSAPTSSANKTARGPAPSAPSSRFHNPFALSSSASRPSQQSPSPPTPIAKSPYLEDKEVFEPDWNARPSYDVAPARPSMERNAQPDRAGFFVGRNDPKRGSTFSLPLTQRPSLDVNQRQRQVSAGTPLHHEDEHAKRSRWRIGRSAQKPRQNSSGSMLDGRGQDADEEESSGFVVKSFRTVSRVHEDPIPSLFPSTAAAAAVGDAPPPPPPPAPVPPATSQFPRHSVDSQRFDDAPLHQHQVESLRHSLDLETQLAPRGQPRRPSLATLGNGRPSSSSFGGGDRDGPGTISAEAFRIASARTRSAVSLISLDDPSSPTLEASRPRFEPQRPQSRMSRRGSNYSDAGSSVLIPPRPSFAIGRHSNGSGSSIDSRSSSTSNGPGGGSPATPASTLPYDAPSPSSPPLGQSRLSFSSSSQAISPSDSDAAFAAPGRPVSQRLSSADSELRLIAAYYDTVGSSPPANDETPLPARESSGLERPTNRSRASLSGDSPQRPRGLTNVSGRSPVHERGPSFSVQPPTPQSRTEEPFTRPKRTSSLQPESVGKALQAMGVDKTAGTKSTPTAAAAAAATTNKKDKATVSRGWTSDSSDEELERLSTSDEESDDEVPLAAIQSRSQTDLALNAGGLRSRSSFDTTRTARVDAAGVAVPADHKTQGAPASASSQQKRFSLAPLGVSPLARRGSNRRSVSTLSFSTSMTFSQAAASSTAATPTLPSAPQRVPYQNRSVSNPSAPTLPSFATANSTAPSSTTGTTQSSALASPLSQSASRDRSSASSGSATTSSSFPHTPKDRSPAVSTLGLDMRSGLTTAGGHVPKPSVKFDLATAGSTICEPRSQRLSMLGAASRSTPNLLPGGSTLGLAPPVPSPFASPRYQREFNQSRASTIGVPNKSSQQTSTVPAGTMNDRLKARHRAEAIKAIEIGRELNDPSGLVPDHEAQEALLGGGGDESDENEPLANLPSRGSMLGGMGRAPAAPASMMSGFGGVAGGMPMTGLPGMGVGGQYSQLAIPPPGVDPYLYASLPPDQKMSLHQRSQQMMAMMQEAAVRAKAESVMGGGGGGGSTMSGHSGSRPTGHGQSMSMGSYDAFAGSMGMPYGGYPQQHPMMMMQQQQAQHMPPFAPPFAMSQHFFQPQFPQQPPPPQHFYGMPAYAGSAIGFSSAGHGVGQAAPSAIGIPSKASGMSAATARRTAAATGGHGRPASAIGTGYRA
ncbi:hypothetical protein JCM3774_001074 [Rhodotorula dairenensis]